MHNDKNLYWNTKQITAQNKITVRSRPVWVRPRRQIVCYQCYAASSYILFECVIEPVDKFKFVENYEKLSVKQKTLIPDMSVTPARHYLQAKL